MSIEEWGGVSAIAATFCTGAIFIINNLVDGKIEKAFNKIKDEKIAELIRANERLVAKNEMLKDGISKMK